MPPCCDRRTLAGMPNEAAGAPWPDLDHSASNGCRSGTRVAADRAQTRRPTLAGDGRARRLLDGTLSGPGCTAEPHDHAARSSRASHRVIRSPRRKASSWLTTRSAPS